MKEYKVLISVQAENEDNLKDKIPLEFEIEGFTECHTNRYLVIGKDTNSKMFLSSGESFKTLKEAETYIGIEKTQSENEDIEFNIVDLKSLENFD